MNIKEIKKFQPSLISFSTSKETANIMGERNGVELF